MPKPKELPTFICSICFRQVWGYSNNAQPVNDGGCCEDCNTTVVIPARLNQFKREKARS